MSAPFAPTTALDRTGCYDCAELTRRTHGARSAVEREAWEAAHQLHRHLHHGAPMPTPNEVPQ